MNHCNLKQTLPKYSNKCLVQREKDKTLDCCYSTRRA
uniref:Uncharacterized protein n=1 Tax=Anguilla anguilla TaxID=7936 RepID=A0A0E9PYQ6_ANGAN